MDPNIDRKFSYRGMWIAMASIGVSMMLLSLVTILGGPPPLAVGLVLPVGFGGFLAGIFIYTRDWYRDLKQYERDREEFNRRLKEAGEGR